MQYKIDLYLKTYKGLSVLKAIISKNFHYLVNRVIIGIDKNSENDYSNEIINLCAFYQLKYCLENNTESDFDESEYTFAISWNKIIPYKKTKLIVFHESLLPKYRGFSPLVNQLLNAETEIGVSAFYATNEFDKGDIIFQEKISINYPIKINEAIELVSEIYNSIIIHILELIIANIKLPRIKQDEESASYSIWREYKDYFIDWNRSSSYIKRFVDAVGYPYLGARTYIKNQEIIIINSEVYSDLKIEINDIGKVILLDKEYPIVICGNGLLKITEAIFSETKNSILPLKNYRTRFYS
ncbi:MAG: methionyl-tRNA formyltransferase [Bacteroidales bacterium]|nr:methionyl-tRNA formyltransferase [Bacteroidales bacterium]